MIQLPEPHMALNAVDVPGPECQMWYTYQVPKSVGAASLIFEIWTTARTAPGGKYRSIVINSHGFGDMVPNAKTGVLELQGGFGIKIGKGIRRVDTPLFAKVKGYVDEIYILACQAANDPIPGSLGDGDGMQLCSEIARHSGAYVYASDVDQSPGIRDRYKYGRIDGFEGRVYRWGPNGTLTGSRRRWRMGRWDGAPWLHSK
jgi:hypothetical protein